MTTTDSRLVAVWGSTAAGWDKPHGGDMERSEQVPLFNYGPTLWDRRHRAATILEIARGLGPNIGLECTADGWRFIVIGPETREALRLLDAAEDPLPPLQRRDAALRRGEAEDLLAATRAVLRDVQAENEIAALREDPCASCGVRAVIAHIGEGWRRCEPKGGGCGKREKLSEYELRVLLPESRRAG